MKNKNKLQEDFKEAIKQMKIDQIKQMQDKDEQLEALRF